jgi:hypothetical protein
MSFIGCELDALQSTFCLPIQGEFMLESPRALLITGCERRSRRLLIGGQVLGSGATVPAYPRGDACAFK